MQNAKKLTGGAGKSASITMFVARRNLGQQLRCAHRLQQQKNTITTMSSGNSGLTRTALGATQTATVATSTTTATATTTTIAAAAAAANDFPPLRLLLPPVGQHHQHPCRSVVQNSCRRERRRHHRRERKAKHGAPLYYLSDDDVVSLEEARGPIRGASTHLRPHGVEELELGSAGVLPLVGEKDSRSANTEQGVLREEAGEGGRGEKGMVMSICKAAVVPPECMRGSGGGIVVETILQGCGLVLSALARHPLVA